MRTVPAGILALRGVAGTFAPLWLVEIRFPGSTRYFSSGASVSFGGNTYEANRVTIPSFEMGYLDRKTRNFARLELQFDNLSDSGSSTFPFTAIEAAANSEDSLVFIHCYSPDASDGIANLYHGYLGARRYSGEDKTASYTVSFFFDALDSLLPTKLAHQLDFDATEGAAKQKEDSKEELTIPVVYGAGPIKIRPTIYNWWIENGQIHVNFIVSGCNGLPFASGYLPTAGIRLKETTKALVSEVLLGSAGQAAPVNLTRFPDGLAHPNVAYGYATFGKGEIDDLESYDIKCSLLNGRPLIDTTIPSENPALILRDYLRDPNFSLGLPLSAFDSITSTANYVGTRYQMRFEFHEQISTTEIVQYILANFHGYITFEAGLIQIKAKRNDESPIAVGFATSDGGGGGRKIHEDFVDVSIKDSSELVNKFSIKYRKRGRNRRWVTLFDPVAQARAGGTQKKEVEDELDLWENGGVCEESQAQILSAITIREDQNGNLFATWASPIWDCIDVAIGDLVTVTTPDVFNNGSNQTFRVTKQTFDTDPDGFLVHFEAQIYKAAIYNDDSVALGVDLLRGGDFTDAQGRAPDVIPVSLTVGAVDPADPEDTDGRMADMLAVWTYPTVDLATEQAEGLFRQFPIADVEIWWHYTDESINAVERAGSVKYPTDRLKFQVDFKKNKSIEAFFVAIGHNRVRSPLGYIPDPTKVTSLTAILTANPDPDAAVVSTALFALNDFVQIENEIVRVLSKTATLLTFYNTAGNRTTFFDTAVIAHPQGTEVAVAKLSYPSLTRSLVTPRFTYRVVTGLIARQRGDGVRTRWNDVNADNREVYYLYWSSEADAGTNPAKLGISNPAWYLNDPNNPPIGINLSKNDDLAHLIQQEDIGGIDIPVFVRVGARNGKNNWSATLSVLATNAAGGSSIPAPTDAPSTPTAALIISQGPNQSTVEADSLDVFRVFASQANNALTFAQTGCAELILIFRDAGSTKDDNWVYVIDDTSLTFVDVPRVGTLGKSRIWRRNVASNGAGGKTKSPVVAIPFISGARTVSLAGITGLAITSVVPVANTKGRRSDVHWAFTQASPPSGPALIAKAIVMQKNSAEVGFSKESKEGLLDEETLQTPGAKTPLAIRVSHPKNDAGQYKLRLVSVDGTFIESAIFNSTSQDEDTGPPNNGVAITIKGAKLKQGGKLIVNYELPVLQMNTYDKSTLIIHDNNSTGTGRKFYNPVASTWVATYSDGSTELSLIRGGVEGLHIKPAEIYVGGRTQFYVRIGVWNRFNGGTATYSPDLPSAGLGLITQVASEPDSLGLDTAAPNNGTTLAAPSVKFGPLGMRVKFDTPTAQMNTHTKNTIRLLVADASGCYWNGLNGADRVTSLSPIEIDQGKSNDKTFNISKADAQAAFVAHFGAGAVATRIDTVYTISNQIGQTLSSVRSKNLATEAKSIVSSRDAVNVLDVRATMTSPANIAPNGDFVRELSGFPGELERWRRWNTTSFPINTQAQQITNATAQADWAQPNHAVRMRFGNTFQLVGQLKKRLQPGETYSLTSLIRSSVAGSWATTLRFHFYNGGRTSLIENMETVPSIALTFPDTNYQLIQTAFRMKQVPDLPTVAAGADYAEHWLGIEFAVRTNDIFIDKIMMVRGEQPLLYAPRPNEQDDMIVIPTFINTPDIVSISGLQGGVFLPGTGGRLDLNL